MTTIYFRVDGNSDIATGHIMRCLAIARACAQSAGRLGQCSQISFLVSDDQSRSLLEDRFETPGEFSIHSLNSDYRNMEAEVPDLLSHIAYNTDIDQDPSGDTACEKPWLFVDSYFASPDYFRLLLAHCRIAYLDDLRSFDCPVDLIINYDTDQDCSHYARAAHKLLGRQYTPLRAQFQSSVYSVRQEAGHVFLSTGGTDPCGAAEYLLHTIYDHQNCPDDIRTDTRPSGYQETDRLRSLHYHIVTSKANTRYDSLAALAGENSHIHLHENVSDMVSLMASCDLAVSAGGTTLSELCAVGVPTISCLMADNQRTAVESFAAKGIIPCAGDIRLSQTPGSAKQKHDNEKEDRTINLLSASVISNILNFMTHMSINVEARRKSSHDMRAFMDGCGASRIADTLLSL